MDNKWLYLIQSITENTAIACYEWIGKGDNIAADRAAVDIMRKELNKLPMNARIAIGEGERDKAPMLYIGEKLGKGSEDIDIAVDPLEGTTICAKAGFGSMSVIAISSKNSFLYAPDLYMEKIAIGKNFPKDIIDINESIRKNISNLAEYKNCDVKEVVVMILERDRHQILLDEIRSIGAKVRLIADGDISAVIAAASSDSDVDIYVGSGGAPEGVLAASALKCIGGKIQGKLVFKSKEQISRANKMGIEDIEKVYEVDDLVKNDVIFSTTGVTDGYLVKGVYKSKGKFITETLLFNSYQKKSHKVITKKY